MKFYEISTMMSSVRHRGGDTAADFFARAKSHSLTPTIVNADSNFVVITYWWGRGNLNKNTQRPCPEDLEAGQALEVPPIKFEEMIANWEQACKKHKCNFLAEEYAEFAVKGGYQHAINFKPYFIELALAACYPRGVLYIDGDMKIRMYPSVCDIKDVDYMARGWNTDPRPGDWRNHGKFCFDPYVFEMSGGTMFFGNTYHGRNLLKVWQRETAKHPGKADDRILSMAIMLQKMLISLSTIQLPIEYLWLDMDYDYHLIDGEDYKKKYISISHPECLTGEDRASSEGAAANRYPRSYDRYVSNYMYCDWDEIYEFLQFEDKSQIVPFKPYFNFLEEHGVVDLVPFSKKYGSYNSVVKKNIDLVNQVKLIVRDKLVLVSPHEYATASLHKISSEREALVTILKYLLNGQHVVYVPGTKYRSANAVVAKAVKEELDFVTRNVSKSKARAKAEYSLDLDKDYAIYFGPNSRVLRQWLLMSESFKEMEKLFNRTYIFLTRIHCGWV
jgi:hypothetical protein